MESKRNLDIVMEKRIEVNHIYNGDSRELLKYIESDSVSLSFWSPPYFLGKEYEKNESEENLIIDNNEQGK